MKKVILILFTLIVTLAVPEAVIRLTWKNHDWWVMQKAPGTPDFPRNRFGFRDYEYSREKPAGTVRIICLGDSFTWGDGVDFDDTYPKRLERNLNLRLGPKTGKRYEVLNVSWRGYSSYQEAARLGMVRSFQPDVLVLGYCLNDSEDWSNPEAIRALRNRYLFPHAPSPTVRFLYRHWSLLSFVANRLSNLRISRGEVTYYRRLYEDRYPGWRKTRQALRTFRRGNLPFMVMIFPLLSYDFDHYPFQGIHDKLHAQLKELGLPYLDTLDSLRRENHLRLQAVPYRNPHPSEIAHHLIEKSLYRFLTGRFPGILMGAAANRDALEKSR